MESGSGLRLPRPPQANHLEQDDMTALYNVTTKNFKTGETSNLTPVPVTREEAIEIECNHHRWGGAWDDLEITEAN